MERWPCFGNSSRDRGELQTAERKRRWDGYHGDVGGDGPVEVAQDLAHEGDEVGDHQRAAGLPHHQKEERRAQDETEGADERIGRRPTQPQPLRQRRTAHDARHRRRHRHGAEHRRYPSIDDQWKEGVEIQRRTERSYVLELVASCSSSATWATDSNLGPHDATALAKKDTHVVATTRWT